MKSVIIENPGQVRLLHSVDPIIGSDDVLLEIQYVGLCGSDLNSYRGLLPLVTYPRVPGHEVSGRIISKGVNVPDFIKTGNLATVNPYSACGLCSACRIGRMNACEFNQTLGVQRDGALSQYFAINYHKILQSETLSYKEFALVEPLSVGYHAVNRGNVSEIDTVLVIGCGMIGIGAILASIRKGATVIAADLDENKLELVKSFGAKYTINTKETDILSEIKRITQGEGVSVCIEAVGSAVTYVAAIEVTAFAGRVIYVGYAKHEVSFNTSLFVKKELTICGSRNALSEFRPVIQMLEEGKIPVDKLISKIYTIDETPVAFKYWDEHPGEVIKILIDVKGK